MNIENLERGYLLPHPAAVVYIVGDPRIALSMPSAQYALNNMILYAQVKGYTFWKPFRWDILT